MDAPTPQPASTHSKPLGLALAGLGLLATVVVTVVFQYLPPEARVWNLSVIGALALFTAARLGFGYGVVFTAVAIALKDLCLYLLTPWWEPYPLTWVYFTGYVLIGWVMLRRSTSVGLAVGTAFGAGLLFFVVSNFVSWLEQAHPYGYSLEGLLNCYYFAIPFYRGTFLGDVVFSTALFGAYAALSAALAPKKSVATEPINETESEW